MGADSLASPSESTTLAGMGRTPLVSFHIDLSAGVTSERPGSWYDVLRPTGMDGWILNLTTLGAGRIGHGPAAFTTAPGRVLLFKPAVSHDYGPAAPAYTWDHHWVYFFPRAHWFEWLVWPEATPGILTLDVAGHELQSRITAVFSELIAVARGPHARRTALAMSLLEQLLLWCDQANPERRGGLDPRIQASVDFMSIRLDEHLTIADCAHVSGLSASRFAHRFREEVGTTPLRFLEQQRIARARELLLMTGRSISAIATEVGMPDHTWFARVFRRHVGTSPSDFRAGT